MNIVLATLNARYSHASLALRYLHANMGELREQTHILEFVLGINPSFIAERLLEYKPSIIGFGVYIWNVEEITAVVSLLKRVAPEVKIILGGPEVSYESAEQAIVQCADYLVAGWGEVTLPRLCREILDGFAPRLKIHAGEQGSLDSLRLPYDLYTDQDIAHRNIYVEASRGCPFKCEFCLSALDKTAVPFALDRFLAEMEALYRRGARCFKFVDRTFNLNITSSARILQFFLDKINDDPADRLFVHFELVPDCLPEALKQLIAQFPAGSLQLEIGIQTLNPEVQQIISRKQDDAKSLSNLAWLRKNSNAHLHADLIVGLPGEDLASFAAGFDKLCAFRPHEIQVGILKRLRGTPIIRHTKMYGLIFDPAPPYRVLCTDLIDFLSMQRLVRFGRYWDLIGNSGRFAAILPTLLGETPFANFLALSDWLYAETDTTGGISLSRLEGLVAQWQMVGPLKGSNGDVKAIQPDSLPTKIPRRQARHLE